MTPLYADAAWELTKERGIGCWLRTEEIEERMLVIQRRRQMPPMPMPPMPMPPMPKP